MGYNPTIPQCRKNRLPISIPTDLADENRSPNPLEFRFP